MAICKEAKKARTRCHGLIGDLAFFVDAAGAVLGGLLCLFVEQVG